MIIIYPNTHSFTWVEVGNFDICSYIYVAISGLIFFCKLRNFQGTILAQTYSLLKAVTYYVLTESCIENVSQSIDTNHKCCKQREKIPGMEIWKPG